MTDTSFRWVARVGSEGGPLLVCAADAFTAWTGAIFDDDWELDPACDLARANAVLYADDDERDAAPIRFGPDGQSAGVIWEMEGAGIAEIAVAGSSPAGSGAAGTEGAGSGGSGTEGAGSGGSGTGVAGIDGAGTTDAEVAGVGIATVREHGLLVMRSWVDADAHDGPRRYVTGSDGRAAECHVADLDLPTGRIAVVWAATCAGDVADLASKAAGALDEPVRLNSPGIRGVGAFLRVTPGRYRVRHGFHDGAAGRYAPEDGSGDGDWSCRWLRLDLR
jgi:hypothetical protein